MRHSSFVTGKRLALLLHVGSAPDDVVDDLSWRSVKSHLRAQVSPLRSLLSVHAPVATVFCSSASAFFGDDGSAAAVTEGFLSGFAECSVRPSMNIRWGVFETGSVSSHGIRFEGISRVDAGLCDNNFRAKQKKE